MPTTIATSHALLEHRSPSAAHQMLYAARQYELYKQHNDLLDFEDLLLITYDAMRPVCRPLRRRTQAHPPTPLPLDTGGRGAGPEPAAVGHHRPLYRARCHRGLPGRCPAGHLLVHGRTDRHAAMLRERCGSISTTSIRTTARRNTCSTSSTATPSGSLASTRDCCPPRRTTPDSPGDLLLMEAETNVDEANMVARVVRQLYEQHPDETTPWWWPSTAMPTR